jgi:hypothetical protein
LVRFGDKPNDRLDGDNAALLSPLIDCNNGTTAVVNKARGDVPLVVPDAARGDGVDGNGDGELGTSNDNRGMDVSVAIVVDTGVFEGDIEVFESRDDDVEVDAGRSIVASIDAVDGDIAPEEATRVNPGAEDEPFDGDKEPVTEGNTAGDRGPPRGDNGNSVAPRPVDAAVDDGDEATVGDDEGNGDGGPINPGMTCELTRTCIKFLFGHRIKYSFFSLVFRTRPVSDDVAAASVSPSVPRGLAVGSEGSGEGSDRTDTTVSIVVGISSTPSSPSSVTMSVSSVSLSPFSLDFPPPRSFRLVFLAGDLCGVVNPDMVDARRK